MKDVLIYTKNTTVALNLLGNIFQSPVLSCCVMLLFIA